MTADVGRDTRKSFGRHFRTDVVENDARHEARVHRSQQHREDSAERRPEQHAARDAGILQQQADVGEVRAGMVVLPDRVVLRSAAATQVRTKHATIPPDAFGDVREVARIAREAGQAKDGCFRASA